MNNKNNIYLQDAYTKLMDKHEKLNEKYKELLSLVKDIYTFSDDKLDKKWCEQILKFIGEIK